MSSFSSHPDSPRVWRRWASLCGLTLILVLLMLSHRSDTPVLLGRYSLTYGVQLAVMLGLIGGFGLLAILSARGTPLNAARFVPQGRAAAWGIALIGIVSLALYWLFFPGGRSQPAVMLFAVYSTTLLFLGWLWALRASGALTVFIAPTPRVLVVMGLIIAAGMTLATLGRLPPSLFLDEAWVANWGVSLYTLRQPVITLMPDMSPALTMRAPLFFIGMGAWLTQFGISLEQARLYWRLVFWACLPALYAAGRRLPGAAVAGLACVLAALLAPPHIYVRMDIVVTFFFTLSLAALIYAHTSQRMFWYGAAGFGFGLMFEGHQFPIIYDVVFGLAFAVDYARVLWREKRWVWYGPFWWFAGGGLAAVSLYLFLHTIPWGITPLEWIQAVAAAYGGEQGFGPQLGFIERVVTLTEAWLVDYLLYHPLESVLLVAGLAWALRQGGLARRLALLLLISQVLFWVLLPKRSIFYYVFHLPFTALFAAGVLASITGGLHERRLSLARAAAFTGVAMLLLTQMALVARESQNADAMIALSYEINADLPAHVVHVAAWQGYYFGFAERQFLNSEILYRLPEGTTLADLYWPTSPPQALLITLGLDDMQTELFDFIREAGFVRVRCYPLDIFGRRADLYLHPNDDPYAGVTHCPA